ncbi:MAG: sugar transporter, partial [Methylobacterium sp. CG09_land_8_20_14_0_10_71_15]
MVRIAAPAALMACLVSGCSILPASGPTASAVAEGAEVAT